MTRKKVVQEIIDMAALRRALSLLNMLDNVNCIAIMRALKKCGDDGATQMQICRMTKGAQGATSIVLNRLVEYGVIVIESTPGLPRNIPRNRYFLSEEGVARINSITRKLAGIYDAGE